MFYNQSARSFFRKKVQIRRNFATTYTQKSTQGAKLQADAALCGRNERPKNGADAKPCLSDVYKSGTRARRRQVDAALCGRSMVEMLGVLAIIGVLSVGAISGYSKAMLRYKLNKQAEQLNTVFNAVARYYTSFNDITQKGKPLTSYFIKMNEIPTEMIKNNNTTYIYDVFNTRLYIRTATDPNMSGVTIILYPELLKQSAQNLEICRNILTTVKENHQSIYFINPRSSASWNVLYGDSACNGKNKLCLRDMSLDYIYKACATHGMAETLPEIAVFWRTDI